MPHTHSYSSAKKRNVGLWGFLVPQLMCHTDINERPSIGQCSGSWAVPGGGSDPQWWHSDAWMLQWCGDNSSPLLSGRGALLPCAHAQSVTEVAFCSDGCIEWPHLSPVLFSLACKQEGKAKKIHPQIQVQGGFSNPEHGIHWIRFSGSVDVAFAVCLWLSWFLTNKWLPSGSLMQRQREGLLGSSFALCCKGEFLLNFSTERMLCNSGEVCNWSCREGEEQFVREAAGWSSMLPTLEPWGGPELLLELHAVHPQYFWQLEVRA